MARSFVEPWKNVPNSSIAGGAPGADYVAKASIDDDHVLYGFTGDWGDVESWKKETDDGHTYVKIKSPITGMWLKARPSFESKHKMLTWLTNKSDSITRKQMKRALNQVFAGDSPRFDDEYGGVLDGDEPADIAVSDGYIIVFSDRMAPGGKTDMIGKIYEVK